MKKGQVLDLAMVGQYKPKKDYTFDSEEFINNAVNAFNPAEGGYDNVEFEGILCSADSTDYESGIACKQYFTVDKDGNALSSYNKKFPSLSFKLVTPHSMRRADACELETPKSHLVEVIRHIRLYNNNVYYGWNTRGEMNARGGATFRCVLNYNSNIVTVYPAICSDDDNFNKRSGIYQSNINKNNNLGIIIKLHTLTNDHTLTTSILEQLKANEYTWTQPHAHRKYNVPLTKLLARCMKQW